MPHASCPIYWIDSVKQCDAYWSLLFSLHLLASVFLDHHLVVCAMHASQMCDEIRRVASGPLDYALAQLARGRVVTRNKVLPDWTLLRFDPMILQMHRLVRHLS